MTNTIKKYILTYLEKKKPLPDDIDSDGLRFFETGHIDSLGLMKFIVQLEDEFGIEITPENMEEETFLTVSGLAELIQLKIQSKEDAIGKETNKR